MQIKTINRKLGYKIHTKFPIQLKWQRNLFICYETIIDETHNNSIWISNKSIGNNRLDNYENIYSLKQIILFDTIKLLWTLHFKRNTIKPNKTITNIWLSFTRKVSDIFFFILFSFSYDKANQNNLISIEYDLLKFIHLFSTKLQICSHSFSLCHFL